MQVVLTFFPDNLKFRSSYKFNNIFNFYVNQVLFNSLGICFYSIYSSAMLIVRLQNTEAKSLWNYFAINLAFSKGLF